MLNSLVAKHDTTGQGQLGADGNFLLPALCKANKVSQWRAGCRLPGEVKRKEEERKGI